jgi:membrane-bound metal-dependent hydrolase YbcI (DUF457 family)
MFIGHFAVGFAAKKFAPRTSLGTLIAAPLMLDLLWPIFLLLGLEQVRIEPGNTKFTPLAFVSYPWTHSLLMAMVWASLFAGGYFMLRRYQAGAIAIWIGVVSHWVLDWITHRPDMPVYPCSAAYFGLGLWNYPAATVVIEFLIFSAGIWLYLQATEPKDNKGKYGLWVLVVLLSLIYGANAMGEPPPSVRALAYLALTVWIFVPVAGWIARHRQVRNNI